MFAADFPQSNDVIDKPPDMDRDDCEALNVFRGTDTEGQKVTISCWKVTAEELEEINKTGRVWVWHHGDWLQPHSCGGHNPFEEGSD
jgi:hypothetical protein